MTKRNEGRARWTDEMLDELADSVSELRESVSEVKDSVSELRESVSEVKDSVSELRESVSEVKDSVDGVRVTAQALLQIAAQQQRNMDEMRQRQEESDQRFEVLLSEVRYLIRQIKPDDRQSQSSEN